MKTILGLVLIAMTGTFAQGAESELYTQNFISKTSLEFKGLATGKGDGTGWLFGVRFDRFLKESPFYWDVAVDFGKGSTLDNTDISTFAGGVGIEKVTSSFLYGARVDLDLVSAEMGSSNEGSFGTEAEAYVGVVLGGGWRLDLTGGYLRAYEFSQYSGATFGIRLDYKAERTVTMRPIND
jgi:hypothetical protein